ncbi:MAG: type I methionyl aminopeptidase [Patescibacteria group bacterium]|jgi:methionyl aminopeptidase|nr:type I methionyl aminopeptidase [Patescibacteria group bacterium]
MMTKVKTEEEITNQKVSGRMLATVLDILSKTTQPGVTTKELDTVAHNELKKLGGKPAFLGYGGFPATLCVSVNDEVVHGIPKNNVIKDGDIVSFDFGVVYGGMITDAARTVVAGSSNIEKDKLLKGTLESLDAGINTLKDGIRVGEVSNAIEKVLNRYNFGIVRDLVGHGVGHNLHEDPNIPNYGSKNSGPILIAGMTVAIEPMSTLGGYEVFTAADGWTIKTKDESLSAHFEDTILITQEGFEILTRL